MSGDPVVALVLSPREWATRLHRHAVDHGGIQVKARILREEEAAVGDFEVLVVDDTTSFLSRRLVEQLHGEGTKVLGVFDGVDFPEGEQRLIEMRVDGTIDANAEPEEFVRRIGEMYLQTGSLTAPSARQDVASARLVVVGGPFGGTGSTEVAIGLAVECRDRGERVVLVDADDVAPSVAQRLGLPVYPNLRTAVDQSRNATRIEMHRSKGFDVVCGIPNPHDWLELRPADVTALIHDLRGESDVVVVDISSGIERLPGDGRFRLARRLIAEADVLVGVGVPTPNGVARLLDWVADARAITTSARLILALNRVPAGGFVRSEVAREIERVFSPAEMGFLPEDRRVRRAGWEGNIVRRGSFTRGVGAIVEGITPS